jgi:hypothetical protein
MFTLMMLMVEVVEAVVMFVTVVMVVVSLQVPPLVLLPLFAHDLQCAHPGHMSARPPVELSRPAPQQRQLHVKLKPLRSRRVCFEEGALVPVVWCSVVWWGEYANVFKPV